MPKNINAEDDILSTIDINDGVASAEQDGADQSGNDDTDGVNSNVQAQDGPTPEQTKETTQAEGGSKAEDKTKDAKAQGNKDAQGKQGQQAQQPSGQTNKGDLVLPDGTVIRGGAQRRQYQNDSYLAWKNTPALKQQLTNMQAQVTAYEKSANYKQYDLSPEQADMGHRMAHAFKADPVGTVKYLLTELAKSGKDVSTIVGDGAGSSALTAEMIGGVVRQQFAELMGQGNQQVDASPEEQAESEWNDFVSDFPAANVHTGAIATLLQSNPNASLRSAYEHLEDIYEQAGMDFSKPITDVANAGRYQAWRASQNGGQGGRQNQNGNANGRTQNRTLPNGRSSANLIDPADTNNDVGIPVADANASTKDIVRAAMRDAGFGV